MPKLSQWKTGALVKLNRMTHRTFALPILVFLPTARCNSRCVSCDYWKADGTSDLSLDEIRGLADQLPALGTRLVVFSGGEPTLRRDVYEIAGLFRARKIKLHLLTSGLFLERDAAVIARHFEHVTVSLDGHSAAQYHAIRGVDGLALVERGVKKLKREAPHMPVRARSTLHRFNFADVSRLIDRARAIGFDGISFLGADVTSEAFGRTSSHQAGPLPSPRALLLDRDQITQFESVIEEAIVSHARDFASGFVAEPADKLRRLPRYYAAQHGLEPFPDVQCNAPWASAVVEADGGVRPCYFHRVVGTIREQSLRDILGREMVAFRRGLSVADDPTCRHCVCSLQVGRRTPL